MKKVTNKTDFIAMEHQWLDHWYKDGVVKKYLHKNDSSKKTFSFLDGPITANNPMGVHHAWGRTYKDVWPRFYNLLGYKQRFQNGFDCQGLWVEVEVEKALKLNSKKDIENLVPGDRKKSIAKFVQACKDRVKKYSAIQTEQSKRLGYFADWDNSYFTMSDENNYMIWHFLKVCHNHGWIYKGKESVPWCPRCQTAISQHEMLTEDYKEVVHDSIFLKLRVRGKTNEYLLIWTTTPWTIPANIAVAIDKKMSYSLIEGLDGNFYWLAKDSIFSVFRKKYKKIIKTVKGKELVGLKYDAPFDNLPVVKKVAKENPKTFHTVIATDDRIMPISSEEGTGLVHTAVSAGQEDFKLGKKYGLPMIPVIADNADYLPGLGSFSGKNAKNNPRLIIDYLKQKDKKTGKSPLLYVKPYKHRYPACWRCKTELVWKVTDEWYIAMDRLSKIDKKDKRTLRQRMIGVAKKIKWMPEFGLSREIDWLKNMHDWLISKKNRYWGLSLPIYECDNCDCITVIGSKEELKKKAIRGWDQFEGHSPHKPYIDEVVIKCPGCGAEAKRVDDIGNPWLDAGIVAFSTISQNNNGKPLYLSNRKEWQKWFPADFITESFPGQFKNWFYALIAMSTVLENENPYQRVLGFGTLLAEDGRPMHKSWGNAINFQEGADKIGVDVMRWMFSRQEPGENMLFGYGKADDVRRSFYLLLWNVYRYFANYSVLDSWNDSLTKKNNKGILNFILKFGTVLDKWILNRFIYLTRFMENNLKKFNARSATVEAEAFVKDLSTWYLRRSRNRIWVNSDNKKDKDIFYLTTWFILTNLSIVLSPFIPFVTEEIYTNLIGKESVHLSSWPIFKNFKVDDQLLVDMNLTREIVESGHRERKEAKVKLRQPLKEAMIVLSKDGYFRDEKEVENYKKLILSELNVKRVTIKQGKKETLSVKYNFLLNPSLKKEGALRELVRKLQSQRKKLAVNLDQEVIVVVPNEFKKDLSFIKKKVLAKRINFGKEPKVSI